MSAKNGLTRSFRLMGCLAAIALLCSAFFASVASAKKTEPTEPTVYINLGDSVSFGYTEEKFDLNYPAEPASAFEGGYPNLLAAKLAKTEAKSNNKLTLINLACPGETSEGLIGDGPISEELTAEAETTHFTGGEAPCAWHNVDGFADHYNYGSVSQLEAAAGIIESGAVVKDVTLQIGSNDELHKLTECASETYQKEHGFQGDQECVLYEASHTLFPKIITNIGDTIGVLRHVGYTGPVAVLGFYNPQAFLVTGSDGLQQALNEATEAEIKGGAFGADVAYGNPFKKINPQQKRSETTAEHNAKEQGTICEYTEECNAFDKKVNAEKYYGHAVTATEAEAFPEGDIHPTTAGDELFTKLLGSALKKA